MTNKGIFITFEGIDGAGKTTQIKQLAARLRKTGREVVETVEPGGTEISRKIRMILLDPENAALSPTAELLLYFSARAQNVDEVIRPALGRGAIVLCDRFTDSTIAYQGAARGLGEEVVLQLHQIACGTVQPDITLFLDIDVETSASRRGVPDRLEMEPDSFRQAVREKFLKLAERNPQRIHRIEGGQLLEQVEDQIWQVVKDRV